MKSYIIFWTASGYVVYMAYCYLYKSFLSYLWNTVVDLLLNWYLSILIIGCKFGLLKKVGVGVIGQI